MRSLLVSLQVLCICSVAQAAFYGEGIKLVRMTKDGKTRVVSWGYQGEYVCVIRDETGAQSQLLIMKSDGSDEQAITPLGNPFFARWSWRSDKLAYEFSNANDLESQSGVYVYDLTTGQTKSMSAPTTRSGMDSRNGPAWSQDGTEIAYVLRAGAANKSQVWIANAVSGKFWQLLPERGEAEEQRWSPLDPGHMSLLVEASGGSMDVVTVKSTGKSLIPLTDTGAQTLDVDDPRWSPTGEWVTFTSDVDMTQSERDAAFYEPGGRYSPTRNDCWVARPDGSEARNLTQASSPSTEKQVSMGRPMWSWNGRWILADGNRFDNQGNSIDTLYLVDPVNGGYETLLTSSPRETGEYNRFWSIRWSYDSTKILILMRRYAVKNWGPETQYENPRSALSLYDLETRQFTDLLVFDEQLDRKELQSGSRGKLGGISWSPDNQSILLTIAEIISADDDLSQPDVYRLDLASQYVSSEASRNIGPPIGRSSRTVTPVAKAATQSPASEMSESLGVVGDLAHSLQGEPIVTETIRPEYMTVEEAVQSLDATYGEYFTVNTARNLLLFKGPGDLLAEFKSDLASIDTPPPHILVDMLAVELTDEANKKLGLDWSYAEGHFAFFQPAGRPIQQFGHGTEGEIYRSGFPSGALDELVSLPGTGQSFYQGVGELPREFFIRLNTLLKDGDGTILANPRTVSMSGNESIIMIRKTLNYFFNEGFDVAGRPIVKKSDISADTEGRIVPTLLATGAIHLDVDVKVGNFTFTSDAGLPELTTRQSTTQVSVQQGQTLVLGGLRQQEMSEKITKVPILGDLPILGRLFKHTESDIKHSVLTIFITPQVLREGEPAPEWPQLDPNDYTIVPIMKTE